MKREQEAFISAAVSEPRKLSNREKNTFFFGNGRDCGQRPKELWLFANGRIKICVISLFRFSYLKLSIVYSVMQQKHKFKIDVWGIF